MDPELIDLLWEMHNELGSAEPIHIISGYRSRATNDMLRQTVGGQASESRHILGKAADVHFPDVPVKKLRYSALIRERGGVGYYPTSAIPFVHVDIDRVRAWPRLPRAELALLFPNGRTQHLPADGDPITKDDVREARAGNTELAAQIAEFHELRTQAEAGAGAGRLAGAVAAATAVPPRLVERPMALGTRPSDDERARLADADGRAAAAAAAPVAGEPARASATACAYGELQLAAADPGRARPACSNWGASLTREHDVRAGAGLRRGASRGAVLPAVPDRAAADRDRLGRRSGAARMVHPDLGQDPGDCSTRASSAPPMRLRPGLADGADDVGAAVQGRGGQHLGPSCRGRPLRRPRAALANRKVQTQAQ